MTSPLATTTRVADADADAGAEAEAPPAPVRRRARTTRPESAAATAEGGGAARTPPRLPPGPRKAVLAAHVTISVGWFGIVAGMLVLGVTAAATGDAATSRVGYALMEVFATAVFPPAAVGALLTGVVLSVGTRWGLLTHRWIVVKLVLTLVVIVSGIVLTDRWLQQATEAAAGAVGSAPAGPSAVLLVVGSAAHLLMLGAASVISVFKPWGRTRRGARQGRPRRP